MAVFRANFFKIPCAHPSDEKLPELLARVQRKSLFVAPAKKKIAAETGDHLVRRENRVAPEKYS
ncbi:hypothetical protein OA84_01420 [Kaistella solincola]|uniref:Uncharacterized protein n=1 Tax=Kaistella solincola TaxID=510955 RepID=A0ABR4ZSE1_9FLAO|nr:hypothetical protein OA84_01420 [Kaistella solincola]